MTIHPSSRMAAWSWVASRAGFAPQRALSMRCGLFHGGGVHPGERLVQQEGVTLGPEGTQEGGAPLLAAGELPGRQGEGLIIESKLYKVFP